MDILQVDQGGVFNHNGKKYKLSGALIFGLQLEIGDSFSVISEKHREMQQSLFYEYFMNNEHIKEQKSDGQDGLNDSGI